MQTHALARTFCEFSCDIASFHNRFPQHQAWAWKALFSVKLEHRTLMQDGTRKRQGPQHIFKTTAPTYATHAHFMLVGRVSVSMGSQEVHPSGH